jgi:biotin-(acetyl-CoA carboxylase) ligase
VDVDRMLEQVLGQLTRTWPLLTAADLSPLQSAWAGLDTTQGRRVRWSAAGVCGTAEGIDETGALLLRTDDARLVTAAVGEVTFL